MHVKLRPQYVDLNVLLNDLRNQHLAMPAVESELHLVQLSSTLLHQLLATLSQLPAVNTSSPSVNKNLLAGIVNAAESIIERKG